MRREGQATFALTIDSAPSWVDAHGLNPDGVNLNATELTGGVSALVVAVTGEGVALVLKQALRQLRVADVWGASPARSQVEVAALNLLGDLTSGAVPRVLAHDRDDHIVALELLPRSTRNWQAEIAEQRVHPELGDWAGRTVGSWHVNTAGRTDLQWAIDAFESFEELRLRPFHETVMRRRPQLAAAIAPYLAELRSVKRFLAAYAATAGEGFAGDEAAVAGHTACLILARTDGVSPAAFLDEPSKNRAREIGISLLDRPDGGLWSWA